MIMRWHALVALGLLQILCGGAEAAQKKSDATWKKELLGYWIVPADSSDATPTNVLGVEIFRDDGFYINIDYADRMCGKIAKQGRVQ